MASIFRRKARPISSKPPPVSTAVGSPASASSGAMAQLGLLSLIQTSGSVLTAFIAADSAQKLGSEIIANPVALFGIVATVIGFIVLK